uniref:C2H2-type domain-containing protein n=1 Tax=Chrysemys picta bellii TaxID=8478 RepID=A0A8C3HH13_CHRPI
MGSGGWSKWRWEPGLLGSPLTEIQTPVRQPSRQAQGWIGHAGQPLLCGLGGAGVCVFWGCLWPLWIRDSLLTPPTPHLSLGPRSKELRSAVSEPQQEVVAEEGDAGQGRLGSPQAPSPEWHECPECGRGFGTSRALKVHRSYHVGRKRPHTSSSSKPPPPRPAPPSAGDPEGRDTRPVPPSPRAGAFHYICAECGLGFGPPAPPREANGARDAEGADGPYHCTECPGEFGLVADLHEHYMLHARGEL